MEQFQVAPGSMFPILVILLLCVCDPPHPETQSTCAPQVLVIMDDELCYS